MRRFVVWAAVLSAALLAGVVALVWVRTERTLRRSRVETVESAKIAFDVSRFDRVTTQFSRLGAASGYTSGVLFQGKTVLAGAEIDCAAAGA